MTNERLDVHYNLTKQRPKNQRDIEREHIAKATADFLETKRIETIPRGFSAYTPATLLRPKLRTPTIYEALAKTGKAGATSRAWNDDGGGKK